MHLTPSGSLNSLFTAPSWSRQKIRPCSLPTQHPRSSTNTPKADRPVANFHSTGARLAVETVEVICRRVTERFLRWPMTASAYPFLRFAAIFFVASAEALAAEGKVLDVVVPSVPMRP